MKPGYLIVEVSVSDPERMARYRALAEIAVREFGGEYLVRGGATETLEGTWAPERIVVLRFPSTDAARRFYASPAYRAAKAEREGAGAFEMLLAEGL